MTATTSPDVEIGTEINLTSRLADEHPDKTIFALSGQNCTLCVNMFRTSLEDLANCLDALGPEPHNKEIFVKPDIARDAKLALDRMLGYRSDWTPRIWVG